MDILEDECKDENTPNNLDKLRTQNTLLLAQLQSLKQSNEGFELKQKEDESKFVNLQQELYDAQEKNIELALVVEELTIQRDCLKSEFFAVEGRVIERMEELVRKDGILEGIVEASMGRKDDLEEGFVKDEFEMLRLIIECLKRINWGLGDKELGEREWEEWMGAGSVLERLDFVLRMGKRIEENLSKNREKDEFLVEIEDCKRKNKELMDNYSRDLEVIGLVNESLMRISEGLELEIDDECEGMMKEKLLGFEYGLESLKEVKPFCMRFDLVTKMVKSVEHGVSEYQEKVKKEKRKLESAVVSLTEENRELNVLLGIAVAEKEALENSLNKLKGNNEQKRVPLLQFTDWGLQRVGFGFMMGGAANEQQKKDADQSADNTACNSGGGASDASTECEDQEVVNLASAVGKLMKNLRVEISQLRTALDDSRSDSERLERLTEKQVQQIAEQTVYIKELEDRERTLTQNVEELLIEMKSTEDEAERWREACELEVEAGKRVIQERDKVVTILTQELEKTRTALQVSNKKLKLKEELAIAGMAAQSAAERSLQLADSRAAGLRQRIEALTRQLEEAESWEKNSKSKVLRRICWPWPWPAFKVATPENSDRPRVRNINVKQMLPETQALLQNV